MPTGDKGYHVTHDPDYIPTREELDRDLKIALSGKGSISCAGAFADDELEQGIQAYIESL